MENEKEKTKNEERKRTALVMLFVALAGLVFIFGALTALVVNADNALGNEMPFSAYNAEKEAKAPHDMIFERDIEVYQDKVVIRVEGASLSSYAPTGSMVPLLDEGANGIRIKPKSESDIRVGDIVSYKKGEELIVHRVIEKGYDKDGIYFITKGDNNVFSDEEKVRFSDIEFITIGIIY